MPTQMCIYVAEMDMEKQLALFIWLKFLCRDGKIKFDQTVKKGLAELLGYSTVMRIDYNIEQLLKHRWITFNKRTGYYLISSFDKLRAKYNWNKRLAVITYPEYLNNIPAFIGAALYAYLYKDFKRKEKGGEFVSLKGDTFTNFPSSSPFDNYKPVATTGINLLYPGISISKASRLKIAANKAGYIIVKKNYLDINLASDYLNIAKCTEKPILTKDGKLYLQQIDTILPLIQLRRRRN